MAMTENQITALRAVLPDTEAIFGADGNDTLFSDDELNTLYDELAGENLKRTAGYACRAMGNTDLLVLKYVKIDERITDGARTAAEWRQAAKQFFDEADKEDALANSAEYFDLIDPFYQRPHAEAAPWPVGF